MRHRMKKVRENGNRKRKLTVLRDGYAELLFDTNARVVIEAPAEFQIVADDRISLNYGKIYCKSPNRSDRFFRFIHRIPRLLTWEPSLVLKPISGARPNCMLSRARRNSSRGSSPTKPASRVRQGEAKKISADTSNDIGDIL